MYRPTVRYDDIFREYVDQLFKATHLDRNQILRGALFAAAHSEEFRRLLASHKKKDVSLPLPDWEPHQDRYWMEQSPKIKEGGKDVNAKYRGANETQEVSRNHFGGHSESPSEPFGRLEPVTGRTGEISSERITIKNQGRVSFTFN